jgi:hypothetical protein
MSTEVDFRRIVRMVTASVQRAIGNVGRSAEPQHARPKLETRNGYGAPRVDERPSRRN